MQERGVVFLVYLIIFACAIASFYLALADFDAGLMFMAIGSGNPHPKGGIEYVRAMNECLIWKAKVWFGLGLVFVGIIVSLIIMRRRKRVEAN